MYLYRIKKEVKYKDGESIGEYYVDSLFYENIKDLLAKLNSIDKDYINNYLFETAAEAENRAAALNKMI